MRETLDFARRCNGAGYSGSESCPETAALMCCQQRVQGWRAAAREVEAASAPGAETAAEADMERRRRHRSKASAAASASEAAAAVAAAVLLCSQPALSQPAEQCVRSCWLCVNLPTLCVERWLQQAAWDGLRGAATPSSAQLAAFRHCWQAVVGKPPSRRGNVQGLSRVSVSLALACVQRRCAP